jgi:poly-gamma-glutamate capsule biosynthesis protein CapA/YwtB (metallophosphatase superfamily)
MASTITIMAVGDLIVDQPDPDFFFAPSASTLGSADLVIGQLEIPHSETTNVASVDVPAAPGSPSHIAAIARAGFDVLTLAGNHIDDAGLPGIDDTIRLSTAAGMLTVGAGSNIHEARRPAIIERGGHRIGVLSYNCVGPRESWATSRKAGAAYVSILTHYEPIGANPGGPPAIYTMPESASLLAMAADIRALAQSVDYVIVALHKGLVHVPTELAAYETAVAHAAVDAGASMVVSQHAHIMRGVEMYGGRPIFHGLGNFVTVTNALTGGSTNSAEREAWAVRRRKLFGFEPDPAMPPTYAFHPESRNTGIAVLSISDEGALRAEFIPCWIDDTARPVPLGDDDEGRRVADYVRRLSEDEGFDTTFEWVDGRLVLGQPLTPEKQ